MYTHIQDNDGNVICTNLPDDLIVEFNQCREEYESTMCPIRGIPKKHGKISLSSGSIYLCSYDKEITRKIFARHMHMCSELYASILSSRAILREHERKKIIRLEHNIETYHKKIQEELEEIIPLDTIKASNIWKEWLEIIKENVENDFKKTAVSLLHIIKNMKLIKAEIEVFDLFNTNVESLQIAPHPIHKVVNLAMQSFWIEFVQKSIEIKIGTSYDKVLIDYPSFSVVLGHIFDNAVKYACPNYPINICFEADRQFVYLTFDMTSVIVTVDELDKIYTEEYSGEYAVKAKMHGYGLGMYYVKKLTEMNEGTVDFIPSSTVIINYNGIPYTKNKIVIKLKRYLD